MPNLPASARRSAGTFRYEHYRPVVETGAATIASTPAELIDALRAYLADRALNRAARQALVDRLCPYRDAGTGQRLATAVVEAVRRRRPRGRAFVNGEKDAPRPARGRVGKHADAVSVGFPVVPRDYRARFRQTFFGSLWAVGQVLLSYVPLVMVGSHFGLGGGQKMRTPFTRCSAC